MQMRMKLITYIQTYIHTYIYFNLVAGGAKEKKIKLKWNNAKHFYITVLKKIRKH